MPPPKRTRVALLNPVIAHYRSGLVAAMRQSERCEYSLFADASDGLDGIPALDLSHDPLFFATRCKRVTRFTWQRGALDAAWRDFDVYILLGNAEWLTSWLVAIIARLRGKRVLFWTHGWTRQDLPLKRFVRNALYRLGHGLLLYGERARTMGIAQGFPRESLYVVYNSLDFEKQRRLSNGISDLERAETRHVYFTDAETPIVILAARLTLAKRFDLVIHALALLAQRGKRVNLLVVGDGPERDSLEFLARGKDVAATFVGPCYDEAQLAELFSCANVTVSPGNIGLTCMHSLAYGVPVITHDDPSKQGPEWEAITPKVTGTLFRRDDIEDLAAAIDAWTTTPWIDAETRQKCVQSIVTRYHPSRQHQLIEMAVLGARAPSIDAPPADNTLSRPI